MHDYPNNDYRAYLQHSAKGTSWGDHMYKAIEYINGKKRYIYDTAQSASNQARQTVQNVGTQARRAQLQADYQATIARAKARNTARHVKTNVNAASTTVPAYVAKSKEELKNRISRALELALPKLKKKKKGSGTTTSSSRPRGRQKTVTGSGNIEKKGQGLGVGRPVGRRR